MLKQSSLEFKIVLWRGSKVLRPMVFMLWLKGLVSSSDIPIGGSLKLEHVDSYSGWLGFVDSYM